MAALLKIRDEFFGTKAEDDPPAVELTLASERVSPREIIRQRVFAEVADVNEQRMGNSRRHRRTRSYLVDVEEGSPEAQLNRPLSRKLGGSVLLDAEEELARALQGFAANRFIMLFDDRQVEGLEDDLTVLPGSEVTFLHLTPLKGG